MTFDLVFRASDMRQTLFDGASDSVIMEHRIEPQVVSADRLEGSLIITFSDGQSGLYDSALLYKVLSEAEQLPDSDEVKATNGSED